MSDDAFSESYPPSVLFREPPREDDTQPLSEEDDSE